MHHRLREIERRLNTLPPLPPLLGQTVSLGANGQHVIGDHLQPYQTLSIHIIPGDPNSNHGLDSNGYYSAYLDNGLMGPDSGDTTLLSEVRVKDLTSGAGPLLTDATKVIAYASGVVSGSPTASDNGFMLYVPVSPGASTQVSILQTGGGGYPSATSGADIFPATIRTTLSFNDGTNTNTLSSSAGSSCFVLSLTGEYIPTGTLLLGLGITGTATSGNQHFVVVYNNAGSGNGIGKTATSIAKGASGTINVYSDPSTATGGTVTAYNLFGNVGSGKWVAYFTVFGSLYLIAAEC